MGNSIYFFIEIGLLSSILLIPIYFALFNKNSKNKKSYLKKHLNYFLLLVKITLVLFLLKISLSLFIPEGLSLTLSILLMTSISCVSYVLWKHPFEILFMTKYGNTNLSRNDYHKQNNVLDFTLQNIGDGVIVVDENEEVLLWNYASQKIFRQPISPTNIRGHVSQNTYFYADTHTAMPYEKIPIVKSLNGESIDQYECFIKTKNRPSGFWLSCTSRPIRNSNQNIIGAVMVFVDITSRKQDEEKLRHYTIEIDDLYNNAPVGYNSFNQDGVVLKINDTALKWLGYARDEMVGNDISNYMDEKSRETFQKSLKYLTKHNEIKDVKLNFIKKNQKVMPVLLH